MPKVIPLEIKSDSIAVYGRMIGIRKMQYRLPMLHTVDIYPTEMEFKEQVLVGDSDMLSETPSRAEDVIITNV